MILNKNLIEDFFGRTVTVKNGQCNEFPTVANVKSKVKFYCNLFFSNELTIYCRHCSCEHHNKQVEISLFCARHLIGRI